ncbi:MAG TPA: helix-turn-helix domain-containing protein [Solirubrobacteraceae bacterium]
MDLVGDKWTLLIVRDLVSGPRRFVELQRVLPGISTEQLRSRLNRMVADGMLTRKRYREVPPRVDYELTERARALVPILGELARWGYEWAWGAPRPSEAIDLGAIFRLIPGLVHADRTLTGSVELVVSDGRDGAPMSYVVELAGGEAALREGASGEQANASLHGDTDAWISALSPRGDRGALTRGGNRGLADALLDVLIPGPGRVLDTESAPVAATA